MELTPRQFKIIKEAINEFDISTCEHCTGSGKEPSWENASPEDACHICGGCGEVFAGGWPPDIREAQKVIKELA